MVHCNSIERLGGLESLKKLTTLRADQNCIERIENLQQNRALTHVNLSSNRIAVKGGCVLARLLGFKARSKAPRLKALDLSWNLLCGEAATRLGKAVRKARKLAVDCRPRVRPAPSESVPAPESASAGINLDHLFATIDGDRVDLDQSLDADDVSKDFDEILEQIDEPFLREMLESHEPNHTLVDREIKEFHTYRK